MESPRYSRSNDGGRSLRPSRDNKSARVLGIVHVSTRRDRCLVRYDDPFFGYYGSYQVSGRDIEGGVETRASWCSDEAIYDAEDFRSIEFLDRRMRSRRADCCPRPDGRVNLANGSCALGMVNHPFVVLPRLVQLSLLVYRRAAMQTILETAMQGMGA